MVDFAALQNREQTLAVVGLGYVGLPLAVAFSRHMNVLGFDINAGRIEELRKGHDRTNEVTDEALAAATIEYTCDPADLARAAVIIVAVPTRSHPRGGRQPHRGPPYAQGLRGGL